MTNITCEVVDELTIRCNETVYGIPEKILTYHDTWFWIYLAIYVALVLLAGIMSGLTLGLLSIDLMTLKIMKDGGTAKEQKQARKIFPIVERHHLLLVTLLLANAAAVEAMPIFLDRISDPIIAICVSVTAVLIFGEVIPQAVCTRYGLGIGATLAPFVYLLMGILFIVAWPLSKLLDCLLGKEHTTFFRRAELKVLVDLHGPNSTANLQNDNSDIEDSLSNDPLSIDEVLIIQGALDMKSKTVNDAMLPIDDVFMIDSEAVMDRRTMNMILQTAHSRIPVYEGVNSNVIALLLVKNFILLNPEDSTPVRQLLTSESTKSLVYVNDDMPLFDLLNLFQTGKSHLAFVRKHTKLKEMEEGYDVECLLAQEQPIIGIITLEDVIEELIQEEIIDETDVYVDIHKRIQVARARKARMDRNLFRQRSNISQESRGSTTSRNYTELPESTVKPVDKVKGLFCSAVHLLYLQFERPLEGPQIPESDSAVLSNIDKAMIDERPQETSKVVKDDMAYNVSKHVCISHGQQNLKAIIILHSYDPQGYWVKFYDSIKKGKFSLQDKEFFIIENDINTQ